MHWKTISFVAMAALLAGCSSVSSVPHPKPIPTGNLEEFTNRAANFNSVIELPTFETTPAEVNLAVTNAIKDATAALDRIGSLKANEVNFTNTVRALDDLGHG